MKKRVQVIIILLFILTYQVNALDLNDVINSNSSTIKTQYSYISDKANIISNDTLNYIEEHSEYLQNEINFTLITCIIKDTGNSKIKDMADTIANKLGLTKKNGIVLLVSTESREVYITVPDRLSEYISDKAINNLLKKYGTPEYKNGKFDEGTLNLYKALYSLVAIAMGGVEPLIELDKSITKQVVTHKAVIFVVLLLGFISALLKFLGIKSDGAPLDDIDDDFSSGGFGGGGSTF